MRIVHARYVVLFLFIPFLLFAQTHFPRPSSSFQPMNIYIIKARLNNVDLVAGDEIGVFDGSTCAGVAGLGRVATISTPLSLLAYKEEEGESGFREGRTMIFKAWDASAGLEYTFSSGDITFYDPETGAPIGAKTFEGLGTAMVGLAGFYDVDMSQLTIQKEGNGTTTPPVGTHSYATGTTVTVQATADAGSQFNYWTGPVSDPNSATTTVYLNGDKTVTAYFSCIQRTLTIAVDPTGGGSTTPSPGSMTVCQGEEIELVATPASGYEFVSWSGPVTNPNNATTSVIVNANTTVTANFQPISTTNFTLTMQVNQSGWGTTTPALGAHVYPGNQVVTINATPATGYRFVNWSGAVAAPASQSTTVTMNSDKTVTANFERLQYTLTMEVNQSGWGTTNPAIGTHSYNSGDVVSILAQPATGYRFVNWTGTVANPASAGTTITISQNETVRANFERIQYTLTITATTGGSTIPAAGSYTHYAGDVVPVSATAQSGYHFVRWEGTVNDPFAASTTVLMDQAKTIHATFALDTTFPLTIAVSPTAGGSTTPSPGTTSHAAGSTVQLTANPNSTYHFVNWTGDVAGVPDVANPTITVLMDRARNITANFALNQAPQHTLTMQVNQTGWGTTEPAIGNHTYTTGTTVTIRALPSEGFRFVQWQGAVTSPGASQTTVYMDGDKTVTAVFESTPQYTLNLQITPLEGGSANLSTGDHDYYENTVVTLQAFPNTGFRFLRWQGDVAGTTTPTTTITMSSNKSVTLFFEAIPQYTITINGPADPSMGTTDPPPGVYTRYENQTMMIRAIAAAGYEFVNWNNDPALSTPTITVTATQNKSYTPVFKKKDDVILTVQINDDNMGDVTPSVGKHTYNKGDVIDLYATPEYGYRFSHWDGEVAEKYAPSTTITMSDHKTVKANFAHIDYRLIMSASPENGGTVTPSVGTHVYRSWKIVPLSAEPAPGYKFTGWSGDVADRLDPTTTIEISGDKQVVANFAPAGHYTLTMNVSPSGTGITSPSEGTHIYDLNQVVNITATPVSGYVFREWLGDVADPTNPQTSVTINADKNVTAVFEQQVPDYYQLTVKVSPTNTGSTTPAIGTHNYTPGAVVTLTATPKSGYHFVSWSGDVSNPATLTTTVTMNENKTVTANFEAGTNEHKFTIDVYPAYAGTTTPAVGSYYHPQGTIVPISAAPNAGYEFDYWTGDVAEPNKQTTTVTIDTDKGVIAIFKQTTKYTLTMAKSPAAGGTVIPGVGAHQYDAGAVVTIQASAASGYDFIRWEGDVADPTSMTTTVTMNASKTVTAIFAQSSQQVILTMQVDPVVGGITGPAPGTHIFNLYQTVTIMAVANPGYRFSHWTGSVADPYAAYTSVTMDQNKTVTAHFILGEQEQVILTISSNPAEGGTTVPVAGAHQLDINSWVTLTATPAAGYHFAGWTGDVEDPASAETRIYMDGDKSVVANFVRDGDDNVIISFNISPVETGTTAPSPGIHIYSKGQVISISAIPFDGYYFAGWYGDVVDPNVNTTSVVADTNKEVTAMFKRGALPRHTLTLLVSPQNAGVTAPEEGVHTFNENEIVNITTLASPGYVFKKWIGNVANPASQTTTIQMTGPQIVIANFDTVAANQFMLTIGVDPLGGGVTMPAAGSYAYAAGELVNLLAIPSSGYRFIRWIGDVTNPNDESTTIRMTENKMITAQFVPDKFTVSMNVTPQGAGKTVPATGDTLVNAGDIITIRAVALGEHQFAYWSGDVSGDDSAMSIMVQKNMQITANFVDLDEMITQPKIIATTNAFRKESVDVFVRNARSNLGHNLEYQFDWGDGEQSSWVDLKSQKRQNITFITTPVGGSGLPSSGQLIDFNTGEVTSISLSVRGGSYRGTIDAWSGEEPYSGTDAADIFSQIVSCRGSISYVNTPTDVLILDFTGLDPSKKYTIAFYGNRNRHSWSQASLVILSGADSFENSSSPGKDEMGNPIAVSNTAPNTKLPADNTYTGYIARFTNIVPGFDGAVSVNVKFSGVEGQEFKGKYGSAVMLQEIDPAVNIISKTAFNDLAWDENFYSHYYASSGAYLIRVRARCKTHPSIVSSWSDVHSIIISGCTISTTTTDGANVTVRRTPASPDYDYGSMVTLSAEESNTWEFTHWNHDRTDTIATKIVFINDHYTFRANFAFKTNVEKRDDIVPEEFSLRQNYPNPFNPVTAIEYDLAAAGQVSIKIYDIRGRLVNVLVDMHQPAGRYKVKWDATNSTAVKMPSGVYFYSMEAGDVKFTKRMVLLK
ncbi:InlB B-repeat-containing protein [candidate division KSB1 bacterium]|nr:InlB B-repeat-containing protein [candidate division KSB1 bacterium]